MSIRIKVMNREDAEKFSHDFHDEDFYIISIHSRYSDNPQFDESNDRLKGVLRVTFSDVDYDRYGDAITEEDGAEIYYWAKRLPDNALLIVHCRAGISRSSATAAALSLIFNGNDKEFWVYPPYVPNALVYRTILYEWQRDLIYQETCYKTQQNLDLYYSERDKITEEGNDD